MPTLFDEVANVPTQTWDISESISELAYLTHNFFRYYGKFPSLVAKKLIDEFARPNMTILDNYAGSGTTLVEAKLAGYNSIGVDVNPFAILACRVKCRNYSVVELNRRWQDLSALLEEHYSLLLSSEDLITNRSKYTYNASLDIAKQYLPNTPSVDKWFSELSRNSLAILKSCILQLQEDEYREFFTLAYFAIIRRVSNAYDGEIRPHINKDKRPRPVWKAYAKKVREMIDREMEWNLRTRTNVSAVAELADNRELSRLPVTKEEPIGLIIAHPPYLNSFDYFPAYNLEFQWAKGFPELWGQYDLETLRSLEIRAWPATKKEIYQSYFDNQRQMLLQALTVLQPGCYCCVVLGDATIHGELVPVLAMCSEIAISIGFELTQIIYRTTHFGVGKYAYTARADYHGNGAGKKDGILVLRKPDL
ncbi:MAG TPA: DNA methyltransferase [Chloroflexia bacterium]|nr:DNA methyltransferase [Chloroflexia bacterium]